MTKTIAIDTAVFDGQAFIDQYGIGEDDFWIADDGATLYFPDALPDTPDIIPSLAFQKGRRYVEVDNRTAELVGAGFVHLTVTFSLSLQAQALYSQMLSQSGALAYPVTVAAIDNTATVSLANAAAVAAFVAAGGAQVKAHEDSGHGLKNSIRSAANQAALDAVVDNR